MPSGYVGADVGCGNGKYIGVNPKLFMVGSDRSSNLISICGERGHEAMVCDGLSLPYRPQFFDFAISIAVIHHFINPERRTAAINEILRVVRVGGRVLIFVWALEQNGKREFEKDVQDVFVPWATPGQASKTKKSTSVKSPNPNSRPQGVKRKDRLKAKADQVRQDQQNEDQAQDSPDGQRSNAGESDITTSMAQLDLTGEEASKSSAKSQSDISSAVQETVVTADINGSASVQEALEPSSSLAPSPKVAPVYNRYYHLFRKGELEDLVKETKIANVVQQGYDRDNWWCIVEKTSN
ncbi:Alkylated DNA repair protein alkB 8 [Lunasporangiospora selenospora]|uniref:Alkylated DNA repair protein alkB 8 n=1 Tax=Lunasporangiospora selenospora TaxID=979761 RepID=A0A9P6KD86_9FUNG|nr:Alkylated DNA repair protein alkB 8 [Lunasporangiospora selenospora]